MLAERTRSLTERLIGGALAASLIAVTLASAPAGAADDAGVATGADGLTAEAVVEVDRVEIDRIEPARTTDASALVRPDFTQTPCPEMTDSIYRLYTSYFLRVPEQGGFDFWTTEYSQGNWSLPRMSQFFSESPEFQSMYGDVSDAEFIDLIYGNIFGRQPDEGGRAFWLGQMEAGLDRGSVMLNFSESPEYIEQTVTWTPLAGHFNWYGEGTEWYCGFDNVEAGIPLPTYADYIVYNPDRSNIEVTFSQRVDGQWEALPPLLVEPGYLYGFFAVPYLDGTYDAIRIESTGALIWTMVFSPQETPNVRAGWTPV